MVVVDSEAADKWFLSLIASRFGPVFRAFDRLAVASIAPNETPDVITEVRVETSSYNADYGGAGEANVQLISKSRTSELHGGLFIFVHSLGEGQMSLCSVSWLAPPSLFVGLFITSPTVWAQVSAADLVGNPGSHRCRCAHSSMAAPERVL